MEKQSRWSSPVVYITGAALIALVAKAWFGLVIPEWDAIVTGALAFAVALGIVNNPENKAKF